MGALADAAIERLLAKPKGLILITGESGVGKSRFASMLLRRLLRLGRSASTICVDDFLRPELRGCPPRFRRHMQRPLQPGDFDFKLLSKTIRGLLEGRSVTIPRYVRGRGWRQDSPASPTRYIICEGLFLDSNDAAGLVVGPLNIILRAQHQTVARWRRQREAMVARRVSRNQQKTPAQVEREIRRSREANRKYDRATTPATWFSVRINANGAIVRVEGAQDAIRAQCSVSLTSSSVMPSLSNRSRQ